MTVSPKVFWVGLIVSLLSMSVVIQVTAIILASGEPSFSVEDDYEGKAARWDEFAEQRELNSALGWKVRIEPVEAAGHRPAELYDVRFTDSGGEPVGGLAVEVVAFHNARAARKQTFEAFEIEPGRYRASIDVHRDGLWELRFEARDGEVLFTNVLRIELYGDAR